LILLVFSSATARAADTDAAAQAYHHALSLYASGDIKGALAEMRESHRLSGHSELLYNIARLEDELGECAESLADYRQYLERAPQGQYRAQASQASKELAARCPPTEAQPTASPLPGSDVDAPTSTMAATSTAGAAPLSSESPAPAVPASEPSQPGPPSEPAGNTRRWLGWSAIAAGGLAGAGAVYFTISALDARSRFRSSLQREVAGGGYADFGLRDEQHRDERWAQVLAVTGGALLGGGVLILALGGHAPASGGVTAGVWFSPGCVSGQVSSRF
jgi:tetratricopeptide (TPR) repeat protein